MIRVLVSACLLGEPVRYNGDDARTEDAVLERWREEGRVVPFCPEVAGGLDVPRPPAEIDCGDGVTVLAGGARVVTAAGTDLTEVFAKGAHLALGAALEHGAGLAVLKEGSPSCGTRQIHDGTFSGTRRSGPGVTSALLEEHGIRVFSESRLAAAAAYLRSLELAEEA